MSITNSTVHFKMVHLCYRHTCCTNGHQAGVRENASWCLEAQGTVITDLQMGTKAESWRRSSHPILSDHGAVLHTKLATGSPPPPTEITFCLSQASVASPPPASASRHAGSAGFLGLPPQSQADPLQWPGTELLEKP